jgi:hypothetical protein
MAARPSHRAKSAHSRKPQRKRTPSPSMPTASAAAILREVSQRLELSDSEMSGGWQASTKCRQSLSILAASQPNPSGSSPLNI